MPDQLFKLQPHRTMHLQGFDGYGAAASFWGASEHAFNLSGVFRAQNDFAVLVLFQKDDPFGHPRFSYLPDDDFTGIQLDWDMTFHGIQSFESKRWPWLDWAYLNAYDKNGKLIQKKLSELKTNTPTGRAGASGTFTLNVGAPTPADRVTLWYQNQSFDFSAGGAGGLSCVQAMWWQQTTNSCEQDIYWTAGSIPSCEQDIWWAPVTGSCEQDIRTGGGASLCEQDMWWQNVALSTEHEMWWQPVSLSVTQAFWWQGNSGYKHSVFIAGQEYYCIENGWNTSQIANNIREQVVARDPNVNVTQGGAYNNELNFTLKPGVRGPIAITSTDSSGPGSLYDYQHWVQVGSTRYTCQQGALNAAQVASNIASQIAVSDPTCTATVGGAQNNGVIVSLRSGQTGPVTVTSSDDTDPATLQAYQHWVQIASTPYSVFQGGLNSNQIAANLADQIAANDTNCTATAVNNAITIALRPGHDGPYTVTSSDGSGPATLSGNSNAYHWIQIGSTRYQCQEGSLTAAQIASNIASQIAAADPVCTATTNGGNGVTVSLRAGQLGPAVVSGSDGFSTVTLSGTNHWIRIGNTTYSCEQASLTAAQIASNIAAQIAASDARCTASANSSAVTISLRSGIPGPVSVSSSDGSDAVTLNGATHWVQIASARYACDQGALSSAEIAANIAGQINAADPNCTASVSNNAITLTLKSGVTGPIAVCSSDDSAPVTLAGVAHWVKIGNVTYACPQGGLTSAQIAQNIADRINGSDTNCTAEAGATGTDPNVITITLKPGVMGPIEVSSSDGSRAVTLSGVSGSRICSNIAALINSTDWVTNGPVVLSATADGNQITVHAEPGADGNHVAFYELHASNQLYFTPSNLQLSGGSSDDVLWHFHADFSALAQDTGDDWTHLNKLWLTFCPALANGRDYESTEWTVNVTNWNVVDTAGAGQLKVAGLGSIRIEENDAWVTKTGYWEDPALVDPKIAIYWSGGRAIRGAYNAGSGVSCWQSMAPGVNSMHAVSITGPDGECRRYPGDNPGPSHKTAAELAETVASLINTAPIGAGVIGNPYCTAATAGSAVVISLRSGVIGPVYVDSTDGSAPAVLTSDSASSASLTIETHCQHVHDIYIGTWTDGNCGILQAVIRGGPEDGQTVTLDCFGGQSQVRRRLFQNVSAGKHTVIVSPTPNKNAASGGWYLYFDYLECAVLGDVPDAPETHTDLGMATDLDTDNTYKLSPQRLIWNLQKIGCIGEVDHYCGVFWWNQRKAVGGHTPSATVTFGGTFADGDVVWVNLGGSYVQGSGVVKDGSAIGKSVFAADTPSTIARHLANFINATLVGVWASVNGPVLTLTARAADATFAYSLVTQTSSAHGTIAVSGAVVNETVGGQKFCTSNDLKNGAAEPTWVIDPGINPPINKAWMDWHADYFNALRTAGIGAVVSFSQELVNPPDDPDHGQVWIQRYSNQSPATTDTGFGGLKSSMCAFSAAVRNYMAAAFTHMAQMMQSAGMEPRLQFGETLWWYLTGPGNMTCFYDLDTRNAASVALNRDLHTFYGFNSDPSVNGYADANFLRSRLENYVAGIRNTVLAQVPTTLFELLWAMDVNDPDTRPLLRYVNLPTSWMQRAGSGFDTIMMEGYQYPLVDKNLDKALRCAKYPFTELNWDKAHSRYLLGWYNWAWPWVRELLAARGTGLPLIKFWAYDHLCLLAWPLPLPRSAGAATFI